MINQRESKQFRIDSPVQNRQVAQTTVKRRENKKQKKKGDTDP